MQEAWSKLHHAMTTHISALRNESILLINGLIFGQRLYRFAFFNPWAYFDLTRSVPNASESNDPLPFFAKRREKSVQLCHFISTYDHETNERKQIRRYRPMAYTAFVTFRLYSLKDTKEQKDEKSKIFDKGYGWWAKRKNFLNLDKCDVICRCPFDSYSFHRHFVVHGSVARPPPEAHAQQWWRHMCLIGK